MPLWQVVLDAVAVSDNKIAICYVASDADGGVSRRIFCRHRHPFYE